MRVLTSRCAMKAVEAQRTGEILPEVERFLSVLCSYFVVDNSDTNAISTRNLRLERHLVPHLVKLALEEPEIAEWLELCREFPILYIDFPMNSWMISQSVQVGAIFVDNGVAEMHDLAVGFGDLRHPTISVVLAPKDTRCKRRLVWEMGTENVHDELLGGALDDLAGQIPSTRDLIAASGLALSDFCRLMEKMVGAVLFQENSLQAAAAPAMWANQLPSDRVRRAACLREGANRNNSDEVRSLFRIVRIGLVPDTARRGLPKAATISQHSPLLCPVWVRGHWRNQRHGSGLSETRRIWIDPHHKGPRDGLARQLMNLIES
ncbi:MULTISPECIES: hypothetical protein [Methylobacterium]|jgi:hypothetical protein|uniref:THIF-type NAD/FAD binding fold domain-containing protein n=1 Tax=Methylobacterium ajmalii TaxID=2738439 RepID=A0ABV0A4V2_9HYPH|nr:MULTISPECIES: hypothetical protein [Methylobacterium]MBK3401070.1 hypothetical protein [Methylobacterium ajmalii]MBK3411274.1 hypothetical protein [Methylobacterium ajmalii]MBK3424787.1 hypothetical protein [Methylobacterium ajmalii]MBZ6414526.1 hypothetical protein [Methylobacterium sp.]